MIEPAHMASEPRNMTMRPKPFPAGPLSATMNASRNPAAVIPQTTFIWRQLNVSTSPGSLTSSRLSTATTAIARPMSAINVAMGNRPLAQAFELTPPPL